MIKFETFDAEKVPVMARTLDSIFHYNADINKTAYLNWRTRFADSSRRQFVVLGEAYYEAANELIKMCLYDNDNKKADSLIFPILFDIVHGMEVYLKAINAVLSTALDTGNRITEGGHDLRSLSRKAKNLIQDYKTLYSNETTEQMFLAIQVVEKFVDNIYAKTDDMTFARYPLNKKQNGHFYLDTFDNSVIDMELLFDQMRYVFYLLDFIYDMPEIELEINNEAIANAMN